VSPVTRTRCARNASARSAGQEIRNDPSLRKGLRGFLLAGLFGCAAAVPSARAQSACPAGPLALVLSGGGAKGLAHVGVLEVLERRGIRPDLIVGTSMGAIIGGMYASGYPARVIDSLSRVLPLPSLFRRYAPGRRLAWGNLLPVAIWEQGEGGFALQTAAVREREVNALFNAALLRGNLQARGDFARLPIPFRAVATDLRNRLPIALDGGDLAQAVRASAAIPLVFPPEIIAGRALIDGGLSANIPVAQARALGATRIIVSDVTEHPKDSLDASAPLDVAGQVLSFLFVQPGDSLTGDDILIRSPVDSFPTLDFSSRAITRLIDLGRVAADSALDAWACMRPGLPRTDTLLTTSPPITVGSVAVDNGHAHDRALAEQTLGLAPGRVVDAADLRASLLLLAEMEPYRSVWLHPTPAGDSTAFRVQVRHASRRVAGLGLAFDNDLGGRLWLGLLNRVELDARYELSGVLTLGRFRRDLTGGVRRNFGAGAGRTTVLGTLRAGTEDVRDFTPDGVELESLDTKELIGVVGVEQAVGRRVRVLAGFDARWWRNPDGSADRSVGALLRGEWDDATGRRTLARGELLLSEAIQRVVGEISPPLTTGRLTVHPTARVAWGDGLPLQDAFPLGGSDGFPGLHLGERRGDREVYGSVVVSYGVLGPVGLRGTLAAGRTAIGGSLLGNDGWLGGGRGGIGADTPLGLVTLEYGVATNGRGTAFVRVGQWF